MIIKVNKVSMQLIQVSSTDSEIPKGLYFVPSTVTIDEFEKQVKAWDKTKDAQDNFAQYNTIGAQRVFAYNSVLEINNF